MIAGKDRGKTGVVERVFPSIDKILVKGIAMAKKHIKPSRTNPQGGILDINLKINASNAMVVCPSCGKPTRIGYKTNDGRKTRICKKCNQSVEGNSK